MAKALPGPQPSVDPTGHTLLLEGVLPFEAMFMASPVATSVSRRHDGCLMAVNDAWVMLTGLRREDVIGRTTVELGHWPSQEARAAFLDSWSPADSVHHLRLCDGVPHRVRLHVSAMDVAPEPLVLVCMTEATREFEATEAKQQIDEALREKNLELQRQVELHAAIEKLARVGHWTNAENVDDVVWSLGLYDIAGLNPRGLIQRAEGRAGIHPQDKPAWQAARDAMD
ncbi:MAG: PAS domain-containing protein, partial [Hydrogenophaga sp.]